MLRLADIKQGDVLYDLGSGDGRIPIMAAQQYGIRAVGIEIDPKMVTVAEERARQANVMGLVSFRNADMFRSDISEATVVTLYLSNKGYLTNVIGWSTSLTTEPGAVATGSKHSTPSKTAIKTN
ncbi:MAG TPA: class I SAM-dependent methyltransferase [Pyrinomonadaceae bacterium]|nr:class I SAM-dependent methyltransferase [Pyrinomonadaceae bacterium]